MSLENDISVYVPNEITLKKKKSKKFIANVFICTFKYLVLLLHVSFKKA